MTKNRGRRRLAGGTGLPLSESPRDLTGGSCWVRARPRGNECGKGNGRRRRVLRSPPASPGTVRPRPMVLPSWMEWETPEVPVPGHHVDHLQRRRRREPDHRWRRRGLAGPGKINPSPGCWTDGGPSSRCGVRRKQPVSATLPQSFDPCAPAGFDKFPPLEGAVT